jgi:hypothetical protein
VDQRGRSERAKLIGLARYQLPSGRTKAADQSAYGVVTDSKGITEIINVLLVVSVRPSENGKRRRKAG